MKRFLTRLGRGISRWSSPCGTDQGRSAAGRQLGPRRRARRHCGRRRGSQSCASPKKTWSAPAGGPDRRANTMPATAPPAATTRRGDVQIPWSLDEHRRVLSRRRSAPPQMRVKILIPLPNFIMQHTNLPHPEERPPGGASRRTRYADAIAGGGDRLPSRSPVLPTPGWDPPFRGRIVGRNRARAVSMRCRPEG